MRITPLNHIDMCNFRTIESLMTKTEKIVKNWQIKCTKLEFSNGKPSEIIGVPSNE